MGAGREGSCPKRVPGEGRGVTREGAARCRALSARPGGDRDAAQPRRGWPRCPSSRALLRPIAPVHHPSSTSQFIIPVHRPSAPPAPPPVHPPAPPAPLPSAFPPHPQLEMHRELPQGPTGTPLPQLCHPLPSPRVLPLPLCPARSRGALAVSLGSSLQRLAQEGPGLGVGIKLGGWRGAGWDLGLALPGEHRSGSVGPKPQGGGQGHLGGHRGTPGWGAGGGGPPGRRGPSPPPSPRSQPKAEPGTAPPTFPGGKKGGTKPRDPPKPPLLAEPCLLRGGGCPRQVRAAPTPFPAGGLRRGGAGGGADLGGWRGREGGGDPNKKPAESPKAVTRRDTDGARGRGGLRRGRLSSSARCASTAPVC